MTSPRRNELYQRPKTSRLDFVFPWAFDNKHWFENFFALIMEGMVLFKFWMAAISHGVLIFLLNAS